MRIALFSPLPPAPTGVADYVADLLPLLPAELEIDLFDPASDAGPAPVTVGGRSYERYPARAWEKVRGHRPYDLCVYQVGNAAEHQATIHAALAHPGLVVLHDAVLHPARVARHTAAVDMDGYCRVADAALGPERGRVLAHLVAGGLGSPELYWRFPLCEDVVRASRWTVVHGDMLAGWLRALVPGAGIGTVVHWRAVPEADREAVQAWRERLDPAGEALLVGTFGYQGPAHGTVPLVRAAARLRRHHPVHLVIVGAVDPALRLRDTLHRLDMEDAVTVTGKVAPADFGALLRAIGVAVNLRYPTARASSGTLAQLLQCGTPTVVSDLLHLRDLPDAAVARVPPAEPDRTTECLESVLRRWIDYPAERERAGAAARRFAQRTITPDAMADSYREAFRRALAAGPVAPARAR